MDISLPALVSILALVILVGISVLSLAVSSPISPQLKL